MTLHPRVKINGFLGFRYFFKKLGEGRLGPALHRRKRALGDTGKEGH